MVAPAGVCPEGEPRSFGELLSPIRLCREPRKMDDHKAACGKNTALEGTHLGLKPAPSGTLCGLGLVPPLDLSFLVCKMGSPTTSRNSYIQLWQCLEHNEDETRGIR